MRFLRHGPPGLEKPGLLDVSGTVRDLSAHIPDLAGRHLAREGLRALAALDPAGLPAVAPERLGPPVAGIGKIIGVGLNYRDHAEEIGAAVPTEPTLFLKATTSLAGPDDPVVMPVGGRDLDWEVELAVVIGRPGVYLAEADALGHVAGYALGIDFSERQFQFHRGGQGFKGKSADSFGPLGPWFLPADAVGDPAALTMTLSVNGEVRQNGRCRDMIFSVAQLVSYASRFMSLRPGDVILTGTPAGVAMSGTGPGYLKPGDAVEASIPGLGTQRHRVAPPVA
ncbi:MAG: 2-hydroxyhepta-2,4-diene,7-dioate isomerase [Enterovirga sp.]|nr:2-hydroxyhepta-2,4-diene,7-dioate isomerase [Enterovirga sp.]